MLGLKLAFNTTLKLGKMTYWSPLHLQEKPFRFWQEMDFWNWSEINVQ